MTNPTNAAKDRAAGTAAAAAAERLAHLTSPNAQHAHVTPSAAAQGLVDLAHVAENDVARGGRRRHSLSSLNLTLPRASALRVGKRSASRVRSIRLRISSLVPSASGHASAGEDVSRYLNAGAAEANNTNKGRLHNTH